MTTTTYDFTDAINDARNAAARHTSEARKLEGSTVYVLKLANDESGAFTFGKDGKAVITNTPALFGAADAAHNVKTNPGTVKAVKAARWHRERALTSMRLADALETMAIEAEAQAAA